MADKPKKPAGMSEEAWKHAQMAEEEADKPPLGPPPDWVQRQKEWGRQVAENPEEERFRKMGAIVEEFNKPTEPPPTDPTLDDVLPEIVRPPKAKADSTNKYAGPPVNKSILIAALIIGGTGLITTWQNFDNAKSNKNNTVTVLVGTYVLILILSLLDLVPALRGVATGLAWLAAVAALLQSGIFDFLKGVVGK